MHSLRIVASIALALVLGLFGASAASATAVPSEGPANGGTQVTLPTPPSSSGFTGVVAGPQHSFGFGNNGILYAWGNNNDGQLGIRDGSGVMGGNVKSPQWLPLPVDVPVGITFTQLATNLTHSLAVDSDGKLYAWGSNTYGTLGNSAMTESLVPIPVETPAGVTFKQVAAGIHTSLALASDGTVYAWGSNEHGEFGNDSTVSSPIPTPVATPPGVTFTELYAGQHHVLAMGNDGFVYTWGNNALGQLGDGSPGQSLTPVQVSNPAGVTFVKAGTNRNVAMALASDGSLYAWGDNEFRQLGNNSDVENSRVPVLVSMPAGVSVSKFEVGGLFALALGNDGVLYSWGENGSGQLGNGSTDMALVPTPFTAPAGATLSDFSAGLAHTIALTPTGSPFAWGGNGSGQLGNNSNTNSLIPVPVSLWEEIISVDRVLFGGVPGTDIAGWTSPTFTVTAPASQACVVDVVVEWSLNAVSQQPIVYPGGFTYTSPAVLSSPADQSVKSGQQASFTSTVEGCHQATTLQWESSTDGATWQSVTLNEDTKVSADGTTLTLLNTTRGINGTQYRLAATNSAGSSVSEAATLAVAAPATPVTPGTQPSGSTLAQTGASSMGVAAVGALALAIAGAWFLQARIRARRSSEV